MIGDGVGNPIEFLIVARRLAHDVRAFQPVEDCNLDRYPAVIGHGRHYLRQRSGRRHMPR